MRAKEVIADLTACLDRAGNRGDLSPWSISGIAAAALQPSLASPWQFEPEGYLKI